VWESEQDPFQLNSSFIALTGRKFIHVWTFDKNIHLPREELEALGLNVYSHECLQKEPRWEDDLEMPGMSDSG
jgi:hypothetical protein